MLFVHFLAKAITIFDFCRNRPKLFDEIDFKQVAHGLKAHEHLIPFVFFDMLDEKIPFSEFCLNFV